MQHASTPTRTHHAQVRDYGAITSMTHGSGGILFRMAGIGTVGRLQLYSDGNTAVELYVRACVCVCVCACACMCLCLCVCMVAPVLVLCIYACVYMSLCMHMCMCMCVHVCVRLCI